jgi:di/tricarboxylate transporter
MNLIIAILIIMFGVLFFYMTYKDGKKREVEFTTDYIMHLKGYFAGIGFLILGLIILFRNFEK